MPGINQNAVIKKEKVLSPEERQIQAFEKIAIAISLSLQSSDKNTGALLDLISGIGRKVDIQIPDFPQPVKKWQFSLLRDSDGFIKEITAKAG
jgi:hypothetical protein